MPKAKDIMTPAPVLCLESDSIYRAATLMKKMNSGVIPIVDEDQRCSGIVTDRDLLLAVVLEDREPHETTLAQVMTLDLFTCHPDDNIDDVLIQMERRQIKRVPVVDEDERCIGIISERDIVNRYRNPQKVFEMASGIYA